MKGKNRVRFVASERFAQLKTMGKLPSPRGVALSIIRLLQRDDYRIADLVQLVQSDPAIAGRILYFANTAAFGRSHPIISLQRAIVALGSFRVRDLVIGLSVMHSHRSGQCAEFDYERYWGHSLATGIACRELSHFAQIASEEIFTLGLLSRIGELALATLFPEDYAGILTEARKHGKAAEGLEQKRFRFDHHQLTASLLREWGLPEMLIEAAFHHENPDAAGFDAGSRAQTLTYSLSFASALAEICMVDQESRWNLLPELLSRAARLGIGGETLNELVDRAVVNWREWGAKLQVRTQDVPPFAEILAATPPMRRMGAVQTGEDRRSRTPRMTVQLVGIPPNELKPLTSLVTALGHRPVSIEDDPQSLAGLLKHPAKVVIADMSAPGFDPVDFCRRLRRNDAGENCYALLLASPGQGNRSPEIIDAGADDVLIKPVNEQALRVHLTTAARMRALREQIYRERQGVVRSTDEFASVRKQLLQEALTDTLTQLPNRRHGLDFLASELLFAQSDGASLACLMMDIDHFKNINDTYGHAAGDAVLVQLAAILRSTARAEDMVFRHGGEEFAAILSSTPPKIARQIAERIRKEVENADFVWEGKKIPVTLSIGIAMAAGKPQDGQALIAAADAAMYQAKNAGRTRGMDGGAP
jgi:diguanylate cyclase (GGDEF)-like protein